MSHVFVIAIPRYVESVSEHDTKEQLSRFDPLEVPVPVSSRPVGEANVVALAV